MAVLVSHDDRMSRQSQIIHEQLSQAQVLVAGVGMLGGAVALALARCCAAVSCWDHDTVDAVNLGNQSYNLEQVGKPKALALCELGSGLPLWGNVGQFPLDLGPDELLRVAGGREGPLVVVSGVDSIPVRAQLANYALHHDAAVFVDTRALGELIVVCVVPMTHIPMYLADLPDPADVPDQPCGYNGTGYVGAFVAGRVGSYLNAFFRGVPTPWVHVESLVDGAVLRHEIAREVAVGA